MTAKDVARANALVAVAIGHTIRDRLPIEVQNELFMDITSRLDAIIAKQPTSPAAERAARVFLLSLNHAARQN